MFDIKTVRIGTAKLREILQTHLQLDRNALWVPFLCLALGLGIVARLFDGIRTELAAFTDRAIGQGILYGVDTLARSGIYIKLMLVFLAVFLLGLWGINSVRKKYLSAQTFTWQAEKQTLFTLSLCYSLLVLFFAWSGLELYRVLIQVLNYLIFLNLFIIIIKGWAARTKRVFWQTVMDNPAILSASLILPMSIIFGYWIFVRPEFLFQVHHFAWHFGLWLLLLAAYAWALQASRKRNIAKKALDRALLLAGLPLLCVPLCAPIANELQFSLSSLWILSPRRLAAGLVLLLAAAGTAVFLLVLRRQQKGNTVKWIPCLYFPLVLATLCVFQYYQPGLHYQKFDLLHLGETVFPTQQVYNYGRIPFVNIWTAHGIQDYVATMLYTFINGYRGVEMLLWKWLDTLVAMVSGYYFLIIFFNPLFCLILLAFFPLASINFTAPFSSHFNVILLPLIALYAYTRKPSRGRITLFWLSVLFVGAWRQAYGAAVGPMAVAMLAVYHMMHRELKWRPVLWSMAYVMGPVLAVYFIIVLGSGESLWSIVSLVKQYGYADSLMGAYDKIALGQAPLSAWQYFILPLVALVFLLHFTMRLLTKKPILNREYILVLLALTSIQMSVRGLNRHCLLEGYWAYYFAFLAFMLPFLFGRVRREIKMALFVLMFALYALVFPENYNLIKTGRWFQFKTWQAKESRLHVEDRSQYENLKKFLDINFEPKQMFYDFISAPLLYPLTDRENPGYFFLFSQFYASDPIQLWYLKKFDKYYTEKRLPVVLFKSYEWQFGGNIDNIPNEVRSYRLAEYMYHHYRPLSMVDPYQVWLADNFTSKIQYNQTVKNVPMQLLASSQIQTNDIRAWEVRGEKLLLHCGVQDPYVFQFANLQQIPPLRSDQRQVLKINYRSSREGDLQVFFSLSGRPFNELESRHVQVKRTAAAPETVACEIPLAVKPEPEVFTDLRLDPPAGSDFTLVGTVLESHTGVQTRPLQPQELEQHFHLQRLPYLWGTYDDKQASRKTKVQQEVLKEKITLAPQQPITVALAKNTDKSRGNYLHFTIKSAQDGELVLSYQTAVAASVRFAVIASPDPQEYLVRISSQWAWMAGQAETLALTATVPLKIESLLVRQGD
ncbi:hypothetical protein JW933_03610 [candidate division FCPU426 bacterium]|nr:hypothetical protein [candidate division FCPU426 bacterium]